MQERLLSNGDYSVTWHNAGAGIYCTDIKYLFPDPDKVAYIKAFADRDSSQNSFHGEVQNVTTLLELNNGNCIHFNKDNRLLFVCPFAYDDPLLSRWRFQGFEANE